VYQRCARKEKDKKRKRQKSHLKKENLKGNDKKKRHRRFQAVIPNHLQEIQIREM